MKRFITLFAIVIAMFSIANAQIVRSTSSSITVVKEKPVYDKMSNNWFVKAGTGLLTSDGYSFLNYNFGLGYQYILNNRGMYVGGQAGFGSACYDAYDSGHDGVYNYGAIYLGPMLGLKKALGSNTVFDGHIGVGYEYMFAEDDDDDDHNRGFWELGLGIWYKRVLFELEYKGSKAYMLDTGILFNIGFRF